MELYNELLKLAGIELDESEQILLTEGIAELKRQYPNISDNDYQQLIRMDPTYKGGNEIGKFGRWILDLYNLFVKDRLAEEKWEEGLRYAKEHPEAQKPVKPVQKSIDKIEDFQKLPDLLSKFLKHSKDIKQPITNFKSVADLASAVRASEEKDVQVDEKAEANYKVFREAMSDGLKVVYQDNDWVIGIPETYESSSHFKEPITNWCTAYPDMYERYMEDYGGKYYIHLNKHTGELYQLHAESNQFKDASDKEINVLKLVSQYPQLKQFYRENLPVLALVATPELVGVKDILDSQKVGDISDILDKIRQMPAMVDKLKSLLDYNTNDGDYFIEDKGSVIEFGVQNADMYGDMLDEGVTRVVQGLIDETLFEDIMEMGIDSTNYEVFGAFDDNKLSEYYLSGTDLQDLRNGNFDEYIYALTENGMSDDEAQKISEQIEDYLDNSFGDGFGVFSAYNSCKETGIYDDIKSTIASGLECKYLKQEDFDAGSGAIVYKIPKDDFNIMVARAMSVADDGDISPIDFTCQLYQYHYEYEAHHMITEPHYGWDGFDSETWDAECDKFYDFLKDLFAQAGKERD